MRFEIVSQLSLCVGHLILNIQTPAFGDDPKTGPFQSIGSGVADIFTWSTQKNFKASARSGVNLRMSSDGSAQRTLNNKSSLDWPVLYITTQKYSCMSAPVYSNNGEA